MKICHQFVQTIKEKGLKYTYNRMHFILFWYWIRNHPNLVTVYNWLHPEPSFIEVEVTTRCGLRCIMCEHTYWNEPPRDISYQEFLSIIDQFPKLKWIGLTGIGESFLNKDFMKMLELVKSRNIFVELYDNLYFPSEEDIKKLVDLQIDKLLISCEAATPELYEKIRPGASFDVVKSHLQTLFHYKKEKKSSYPKISFHYIVMKNNRDEIPSFINFVSEMTSDSASIQITRMLHFFPEVEELFTDISDEFIQKCEEIAKKRNVHLSWNLDVPINKPPITHCIEWTMPFIFATGHVIPCCAANESNRRDFQKRTAMGNIFEKSFKEIWNSEPYQDLRKKIRRGQYPPACVDCCLYDHQKTKEKS